MQPYRMYGFFNSWCFGICRFNGNVSIMYAKMEELLWIVLFMRVMQVPSIHFETNCLDLIDMTTSSVDCLFFVYMGNWQKEIFLYSWRMTKMMMMMKKVCILYSTHKDKGILRLTFVKHTLRQIITALYVFKKLIIYLLVM